MRRLRWIIIAAFVLILAFVTRSYYSGSAVDTHADSGPVKMDPGVGMQAQKWSLTLSDQGREKVRIRAQRVRENKDTGEQHLDDVDLEIPKKIGGKFDKIHTAKAEFDAATQTLFAEGEVVIILAVPEGEEPN